MWRAARNASSVNGGRLPYSLGTVASAARPSQLNTARQTSLGRFRPIASISQEVLTRKEGTMPLAPCPLCAASIPPHLTRSDDVEGEKRASIRRRSRTLTGSCERTSGQKKRDGAPSAFFLIGQVGRQAPGTRPTTPFRLTSRTRPRTPSRTLPHIRLQYWKRAARAGEHAAAAAAAAAAAEQAASPHRLADPSGAVGSSETTAT